MTPDRGLRGAFIPEAEGQAGNAAWRKKQSAARLVKPQPAAVLQGGHARLYLETAVECGKTHPRSVGEILSEDQLCPLTGPCRLPRRRSGSSPLYRMLFCSILHGQEIQPVAILSNRTFVQNAELARFRPMLSDASPSMSFRYSAACCAGPSTIIMGQPREQRSTRLSIP